MFNQNDDWNYNSAESEQWQGTPDNSADQQESDNAFWQEQSTGWRTPTTNPSPDVAETQPEPVQPQELSWNQWSSADSSYSPEVGYPYPLPTPKKPQEKKKGNGAIAATLIIAVILSGTVGFAGGYLGSQLSKQENTSSVGDKVIYQAVDRTTVNSATEGADALSVADVAKLAADSVVEIRTESVTSGSFMQQYISEGAGSGVIITTDGYIVTNNHVIDGASKITVRLRNGDTHSATLIGKDAKTDIAVIKVEATELTAAVYGDFSKLIVGETAIAIGNPLGELGGTVTSGIISALDRSITIDGETMTLLQTNAAINPGNSGGGLFNSYGELIGIVNAKSSGSDIEGLGFAIPISTAKPIIEEIIKNGYVSGRITLGITIVDIPDTQTAMTYRVSKTGVYVSMVNDQASGFQAGDRIITFNGVAIDDAESLTNAIEACKVGQTVSVEVERRNQRRSFEITLQEEKPQ